MGRYLAILALVLVILALASVGNARLEVAPIQQAQLLLSPAAEPPPADDPRWTEVRLPDDWRDRRPDYGGYAWYRATFRVEDGSSDLWAVYLPRINMNAAVYLNGHYLGSGGAFEPEMARNWNRPLYFRVPGRLLNEGENSVHVRLKADAWAFGMLGGFYVAPDQRLREAYEIRYFVQITFIEAITLIMLAMAALVGVIWLRRRHDSYFGWFALASLTWAFNNTNLFLAQVPLPLAAWEWGANLSLVWMVLFLLMFALRYLEKPRLWVERAMFAVALTASVTAAILPARWFFPFIHLSYALMIAFAVYVLSLVFITFLRERSTESAMLSVVGMTLVLVGAHDLLIQLGWAGREARHSLHQGSLVLFLVIGGILVNRFVHALGASETLARELEQRVAQKHRELEQNYERVRKLEREQVLVAERERIMRDMHDGMGGQLIAALALAEAGGERLSERITEALRGALDDLRLMIDSLDPVEEDLAAVLGMFRSRMEPRLTAGGVRFLWRVEDLPPIPGLGPRTVLQVLRILQEALCNAMKHAQARTVTMTARSEPNAKGEPGVLIELADDGLGFSLPRREGRGMSNMHQRARAAGANLEIRTGMPGTAVRLWLPV